MRRVPRLPAEEDLARRFVILRRRGGRPPMGSAAAAVESVRLDPELNQALRERAEKEGRTNSDLIRDALRLYLHAS